MKLCHYQYIIENYFVPKFKQPVGNDFENQIFMQDRVSPHTAKAIPEKTFRRKNNKLQMRKLLASVKSRHKSM